jgi:uncharacterized membrane protein
VQVVNRELVGVNPGSDAVVSRLASALNKLTSAPSGDSGPASSSAGAFYPVLVSDAPGLSPGEARSAGPYDDVSEELRQYVQSGKLAHQIRTVDRDGGRVTFLMVGAPVPNTSQALQLYMLFPLTAEQNTISLVQNTLIVGGVVLLSTRGRLDARRWSRWALLLPFSAALIRGLVQPLMKLGLALWPEPLAATLIGYTVSAAVILAVGHARGERPGRNLHPKGAPLFAVVGLLNGGSVLLMYSALSRDRVSLVAPLIAVYPLFTLAFGAVLLRSESLHSRLIAGIALTVIGVAITVAS